MSRKVVTCFTAVPFIGGRVSSGKNDDRLSFSLCDVKNHEGSESFSFVLFAIELELLRTRRI